MEYIQKSATVLDTQFITYLASGHTKTFCSLEEACEFWGVPMTKSFDLGAELEKVGHDIRLIPDLDKYLMKDVEITSALIQKILEDKWVLENFAWILKMHDGFLGTQEIEFNGMHVDVSRLGKLTSDVATNLDIAIRDVRAFVSARAKAVLPRPDAFEPTSNDHVAAFLYGGDLEIVDRIPAGVFASGKKVGEPKFSLKKSKMSFVGLIPRTGAPVGASGKLSVNDEALSRALALYSTVTDLHRFVDLIRTIRELSKLYGTYLSGLGKHLRITGDKKYYVFPQINTTQTATGRTSSSKPNMQNNPTHDSVGVASIYTSRYGKDGVLLEVDFKQVEILALAILSNDPRLIDDILTGRDIHAETGHPVFGSLMTKEQRRVIKTINFGLIYGGSAATLASQAGVSKGIATKAINSFYARYPGVKLYFEKIYASVDMEVRLHGKPTGQTLEGGFAQTYTEYLSETGRKYVFKTYYNDYSKEPQVSYTETRNYPIQGLATGDLMLAALGEVWRRVLPKYGEDVKLVGLVHDSLRFDLKLDKLDDLMRDLKYTLENSGKILNRAIKRELWTLPVKVTFSKGTDFFNMKELDY
jgi:DNA polymerase I-like protein with 3'-5' exonuclease and polymerase domains